MAQAIESKDPSFKTDILDLADDPLPLWDDAAWNVDSSLSAQIKPYKERVAAADALVLVVAEWAGMAPAGLKNFLLYLSSKECAHKPALLVGVSSSRGGAYPIAELRMSGYKNNRMVYIPDHLIVRDCEAVMNASVPEEEHAGDAFIQNRAHYSLKALIAYAKALKAMRAEHDLLDGAFPNGQ